MPAKSFKFISPGVFVNEIDNSQVPATPGGIGPVVIGRSKRGPGLIPTKVNSFEEYVRVFGEPIPGTRGGDVFRNGNEVGPTYGAYAAQAWLKNNTPVTYVRLVGRENNEATDEGKAGWATFTAGGIHTTPDMGSTQGGAYGLFLFQSSSTATSITGTLAAVWYVNSGSVYLSGTAYSASVSTGGKLEVATADVRKKGTSVFFGATGTKEFKAIVETDAGEIVDTKFNFTKTSDNFIRKVFNTNPILSNTTVTSQGTGDGYVNYWLGETYEDEVSNVLAGNASDQYGVILPLFSNSLDGADFRRDFSDPKTGWFISQDLSTTTGSFDAAEQQKLFRIVAKNTGRWASRNLKISIQDIRRSSDPANAYGTFSVVVRDMKDSDNKPRILEQFNNCNLNPASQNFVGRKIGDRFLEWDDTERRYRLYGNHDSQSDYIYVDMNSQVEEGKTNPELLPFGVFGPPRFDSFDANDDSGDTTQTMVSGGFDSATRDQFDYLISGSVLTNVTFEFPKLRLRVSASDGNPNDKRAVYFGVDTTFGVSGIASETIGDYTGPKPTGVDPYVADSNSSTVNSWVFTLDDMMNTDTTTTTTALTGTNVYVSGSRQLSPSERQGGLAYVNSASYSAILDLGADRFTTVMHGGYDGLDITEAEPFRNSQWDSSTTETNSYTFNSVRAAIDSLRDKEEVEFDLAAMPGITNNALNRALLDMCEDRADAMGIVDLEGGYVPETENTNTVQNRLGSVDSTINNKRQNLQTNTSFGAAYYPWVQIQDTINGASLWAPPSIAALGAMSYGQANSALWFAPAGFTRGGLSKNFAAGIPVTAVRERLNSKDRDKLYEANINPIAQFPSEGIVIFGQKTLQVTPSALDRINVRRLLIFLKKRISQISSTLLFDQNVQATWNRFLGQVEPFLASVRAGLGLSDYQVILNENTTTPDLIDRNIMYAKIRLKPARAIEYIAVDFVITDSGASFDD